MKTTRRNLVEIHNIIERISSKIVSPKLAFRFIKIKQAVKPEIEAIAEAQRPLAFTPEIEAYNAEQKALSQEDPEYRAKSLAIYEAHKELVEGYREKEREFSAMLAEEIEIDAPTIDPDSLPEDLLTIAEIETLSPLMEEKE